MNGRARAPLTLSRWLPLAAGLVLVAAGLAAYARSFSGPFVFDDAPSIVDNPTIRHLWPPGPVFSPPPQGLTVSGRPVLNLSFALNYALSGTSIGSYHAFNLGIHLLAALTLLGIVRRTPPRSLGLAFAVALLWAVHPLQTEAVTYVVQRAESLMGLFYLLTLYGFIRYAEDRPVAARAVDDDEEEDPYAKPKRTWGRGRWAVLSVVACLCGMGTKEVMVSAPVLVFFYDRTFRAGTFREAWGRRRGFYLALAATWIPLGWLVAATGGDRGGTSGFDVGVGWWAYGLTQFRAVVGYLELALWPRPLVFEYGPFWVSRPGEALPYAAVVILLGAGTLWALRRRPVFGFLGLWFFAILAPTSLVPGTLQMVVEHRMYLPLAAVIVAAAAGLRALLGARASVMLVVALAVGLGAATFRRNRDYQTELGLWSDTAAKRPDNPNAHYALGVILAAQGRTGEAIARYERALQLKPDYSEARLNLGNLLAQSGRLPEALAQYEEELRRKPRSALAHNNYGNALAGAGRAPEALAQFEEALRDRTYYPEAEYNLGNALASLGRGPEAIARYRRALRLRPNYAEAHANLGVALARAGHLDQAIPEFEAALRLRPAYPEELFNLGNAMAQGGHWPEAMGRYEEALRLQPGYAEAHNGLGGVLAEMGRYPEAREQFEEALQFRPDFPQARASLARIDALLRAGGSK